ncbi:MAG: J domain-containing protein [Campylobacterota bacterium]|nr:J domain-containing protein [Campylobacterota bacterium]
MDIVLQNNLVLIRTDFETIESSWMQEYINLHVKNSLFLPHGILIFHSQNFKHEKEKFIRQLCSFYATTHDLSESFYIKSMLRCSDKPIKIELTCNSECEYIGIDLCAHDSNTVEASLYMPNRFIISYLCSQLSGYVKAIGENSVIFDVSETRAKTRLERTINKRHVLHYQLQYQYDSYFMPTLYDELFDEEFDDTEIDEMMHYYTALECQVGATQDALRKSYKKLVKVYHPDRVHCENNEIVNHYTQKFQLLQEAYTALRIVS